MNTLNEYKNKLFSVLGDSMSTLLGYSTPEYAAYYDISRGLESGVLCPLDTWWGQVIDQLGGELIVNNSFSGSTVCFDRRYEIESYGCSDERTSSLSDGDRLPDVIMVFIGLNDWGKGTRLSADGEDLDERLIFSDAYAMMLKKLRRNYPNAELWCFTLPVSKCTRWEEFSYPYRRGGIHIEEYCEAIRECAAKNGCRLIDLYSSAMPYDTLDGFHPTADGMKTLSEAVLLTVR